MPKNIDKGNGTPGSGRDNNLIFEADGVAGRYTGGRGDDTYFVDHADDVIIEKNNGGEDSVIASVDWTLDENVENLTFEGDQSFTGIGNAENNKITGSLQGDTLDGGLGDDVLFGDAGDDALYGGDGSDTLYGGDGIDTAYFSGSSSDYLIEVSGDDVIVMSLGSGTFDYVSGVEFLAFDDTTVSTSSLVPAPTPTLVATPDSGSTTEETGFVLDVLANDAGEGLQIVSAQDGQLGKVTINADGTLTYTPYLDATGDDIFSYTVMDQTGSLATTDVTVEIQPVNDAPVAVDDTFTIDPTADFSGQLNILINDADPDGDLLSVQSIGETSDGLLASAETDPQMTMTTAAGGTIMMAANGSFSYVAADGYSGADSFSYAVSDGNGELSSASVTLDVVAATNTPVPEPAPTDEVPYYIDDMIYGDPYRLNAGQALGSSITVTYAFLTDIPEYYGSTSEDWSGFSTFSEEQRDATGALLAEIETFSSINFVEVEPSDATITFGLRDLGGTDGMAYLPTGTATDSVASDIWIDTDHAMTGFDAGSSPYDTLMHEIGHSLGMRHPTLPSGEDTKQYSVMEASSHPDFGLPDSYQLYDVAALQYLYGANGDHASGDDVYGFETLSDTTSVIWDSGGTDTLDMSAATYGVDIDLNSGAFSDVTSLGSDNVAIAFDTTIENAIGGSYDDTIVGNEADNWIDGGAGNDSLAGGDGADTYGFGSGWGQDTVEDFAVGEDRLDFSGTGLTLEDLFITTADGNTYLSDGENTLTLAGVDGVEQELDETFLLF